MDGHVLLLVLAVSLLLCSCGEVKIESITLSKNAAELKEGESVTLSAVVAPENTTESYGWKSADESVATVDENGVVTAVAPGNTNILAVSESGKTAAIHRWYLSIPMTRAAARALPQTILPVRLCL